jgi:hypothetical protein
MALPDDVVPIAPTPQTTVGPSYNIKTFRAIDSAGNTVEVQGVALVDMLGSIILPATEVSMREAITLLRSINNILAATFGGQTF